MPFIDIKILIINLDMFSTNYCSSIYGVNAVKHYSMKYKSGKQWEIFKTRQRHPLLRDLKWINFNSMLWLNETSFMYKNRYALAVSNVKKINLDVRNKVSQLENILETAIM